MGPNSAYIPNDPTEIRVQVITPVLRDCWVAILGAEYGVVVKTAVRSGHRSFLLRALSGRVSYSGRLEDHAHILIGLRATHAIANACHWLPSAAPAALRLY